MASIIRIKRSSVSGNPSTLAAGEIAYSALADNGSNGGDRLYIGMGAETDGNAANHVVIGGKFFTDRLDHAAGTLTASSAIVVDGDSKIDVLNVDNITLNGNTISTTDTNGNLTLSPNGSGLVSIAGAYTLPRIDGSAGYVLTTDGLGAVSWAASSSNLGLAADSGTGDINLLTETFTISGGEGIDTSISGNTLTIAAELATSSNAGVATFNTDGFVVTSGDVALKGNVLQGITTDSGALTIASNAISILGGEGIDVTHSGTTITVAAEVATSANLGVASFNTASFTVTAGDVTIKSGGVSNSQLANSSVTIGSTSISLGSTSTSLAGITELTVDNLNFNSNTIAATNTDGNIVLAPLGDGTVDVSGKKITGLATPEADTDAANKLYVDTVAAEGLHVQDGVDAATTDDLATLSGGTITYDNGTGGAGATLVTTGSFTTGNPFDGVALSLNPTMDPQGGGRILVKNEATAAHNGIYYLIDATTLKRDPLFDSDAEVEGGDFVFVVEGTINAGTGWVQTATVNTIGTDPIVWAQFSGAGTYTAGSGLLLDGTEFSVKLAASGGLEFSGANAVQLKAGVAGDGLSYSTGVMSVGGTTDRITVNSDAVDIASTYAGQTSITTLGTITTGTWSATAIAVNKGGTGLTSYTAGDLLYASGSTTLSKLAAGAEGKILQINASGVPVWGDIDGGTY